MKLFLAIVVILMLLPLSTGVETSDNHASRSATALIDRLLRPKGCLGHLDNCWNDSQCCGALCCSTVSYCSDVC
nr:TPA_inf: conotoxin precursor I3 [Conus judaeus]DAZ86700.1 TPA_inf: conotoxin precursor I3 [Conus judaeus]